MMSVKEGIEMGKKERERSNTREDWLKDLRIKELESQGFMIEDLKSNSSQKHYDSEYTMENGTATFIYLVVMAIGTLFVDRWIIYIVSTVIYAKLMARHKKNN